VFFPTAATAAAAATAATLLSPQKAFIAAGGKAAGVEAEVGCFPNTKPFVHEAKAAASLLKRSLQPVVRQQESMRRWCQRVG